MGLLSDKGQAAGDERRGRVIVAGVGGIGGGSRRRGLKGAPYSPLMKTRGRVG